MLESKKMVLPLLLLLLGLSACSTCSEKVVVPLIEKVPADASLVLEISDTEEALKGFGLYVEQISRGKARPLVKRLRAALETQAGIQMFKPKAWRTAGINMEKGLVFFIREDQKMLYLESSNAESFEKAMAKLAARLDSATKRVDSDHNGTRVVTLGRPFGAEVVPVLHYAQSGSTFLLALGGDASGVAQTLALSLKSPKEGERWVDDALVQRLTKKISQRSIRIVGRAGLAQRLLGSEAQALSDGAALGWNWGPTGIELDGFVDFKVKDLEKVFPSTSVFQHARLVEADGALILLTDAARPELFRLLRSQPVFKDALATLQSRSLRETGLDIEAQVLEHLAGPVAMAVHLQDITTLYKRMESGERRLRVLLDSLQVAVVAKVKAPAAMQGLLEQSYSALRERGIALRKRSIQVGDEQVHQYEPDKAAPRMGWGMVKGHYYYGAGLGRAEKMARHLLDDSAGASQPLAQSVASTLAQEPGAQVVTLRSEVVAQALGLLLRQTNIPAMAKLGLTQQADMILALLAGMDDVALSVNSEPQAVVLKVRQRL